MSFYLSRSIMFIFAVTAVLLSLQMIKAPHALHATAASRVYSAERAFRYLRVIAAKPHPSGSQANLAVQDYIMRQLQFLHIGATVINRGRVTTGATREGDYILARCPGLKNSKAVMLVAHYDSVTSGPGAGDDGAAVAALLEVARALQCRSRLKNDIFFLFTNGEENGSVGAQAFVADHQNLSGIGLVCNFDARGTSGPSVMYETSDDDAWLMQQFAECISHPVTSSIFPAIYHIMPNETDFTCFHKSGVQGFNFAIIKGVRHYHRPSDDLHNVDLDSIQHQGGYAFALASHFGNCRFDEATHGHSIFFTLPMFGLILYPAFWSPWIMAMSTLLLVVVGHLTGRSAEGGFAFLTPANLVLASLSAISRTILCLVLAYLVRYVVGLIIPDQRTAEPDSLVYVLVFQLIACTIIGMKPWQGRTANPDHFIIVRSFGYLVLWEITGALSAFFLPDGSFLFSIPLVIMLIAWMVVLMQPPPISFRSMFAHVAFATASFGVIILVVPIVCLGWVALTLRVGCVVMLLCALLAGLLIPQMALIFMSDDSRKNPAVVSLLLE